MITRLGVVCAHCVIMGAAPVNPIASVVRHANCRRDELSVVDFRSCRDRRRAADRAGTWPGASYP